MSFSINRRSAQEASFARGQHSPDRDTGRSSHASERRRIKFPPDDTIDDRTRSDYFSKTKELLSGSKMNYRSPKNERDDSESRKLQFSGTKSPPHFRTSLTTTNRNRVKFDLRGDQTRERPQFRESFLSLERDPIHISDRLSPTKYNILPSTGRSNALKQDRSQIEDLAQRMSSLEKRMESDQLLPSPDAGNTLSTSKRKSSQSGFFARNELGSQESQFNENQARRSRLKFFGGEESASRSDRLNLQSSTKGEETKFSKTYIDHIQTKHDQRVEELELRYKEKCKEFNEYKAATTLKLEESKEELQKTLDKHSEDTRKVQRDFEFQTSKKSQEHDFELKSLRNKNRDLEEQVNSLNRKLELLQKELRTSETANKDSTTEHKAIVTQLEEEISSLKGLNSTKIQHLTENYDKERKRLKESYEKLIDELSSENKQTYKKLNDEILKRDKRIKDLEKEYDAMQKSLHSKIETLNHDVQILQETNRSQKKNLEECREEILKLTSQLDDRKRETYILETQVELLKTEKSRYEAEWLKGEKFRRSGLSYSTKKAYGMTSPE